MRRRWGWTAAVAALSVITGGIAGGAVAFSVFALPASQDPVISGPIILVALERTRAAAEAEPAPPTAAVVPDAAEAPGSSAPSAAIETAVSEQPVASAGSCPAPVSGSTPGAPGVTSAGGVAGTTTADLEAFAAAYNAQRVANCLAPVPPANIRYDACMEARLFWMAEDPSSDTSSAWGHVGSQRSDGLPSVGCDGNLAGGMNNVAATFARKWWDSPGHRISLYTPDYTGSMASVCVYFAVTHGGVPDEPAAFARAAARWGGC